jgi:hypothetical protein
MLSVSLREKRYYVAGTKIPPNTLGIIAAIAKHAIRTVARTPILSLKDRDGVNKGERLL